MNSSSLRSDRKDRIDFQPPPEQCQGGDSASAKQLVYSQLALSAAARNKVTGTVSEKATVQNNPATRQSTQL